MKLSQFNTLPRAKKAEYIFSFIGHLTKKPTITSALVFVEYSILFVCDIYGNLVEASAEVHSPEEKEDALKILKGKKVIALDCSNFVEEDIMNKVFKNRLN